MRKREVFGGAMYDFANSGDTSVVITAVFAAYFVGGIAGKAPWAIYGLALLVTFRLLHERAEPNPDAIGQGGLGAPLAQLRAARSPTAPSRGSPAATTASRSCRPRRCFWRAC